MHTNLHAEYEKKEKVCLFYFQQPKHYFTFSTFNSPLPISSNSMARAITSRLSVLKGSVYRRSFICLAAASIPPLFFNFNSIT